MSVPEDTQMADRISSELAGIHRESYGEDVQAVKTYVLEDLVVCVMDVSLLPHERTLLEKGGSADAVRRTREEFQEAIGATFIAAVEHFTGRRVVAFLSDTHLGPDFSVEIFRLGPPEALDEEAQISAP